MGESEARVPTVANPPVDAREARRIYWRGVLAVFPFVYVPIAAAIAALCAAVMPWLTGAFDY